MGYEQKESKATSALPADLPNAAQAVGTAEGFAGAIYKSDNGKRYRLRHPAWVEIKPRAKKPAATAKTK